MTSTVSDVTAWDRKAITRINVHLKKERIENRKLRIGRSKHYKTCGLIIGHDLCEAIKSLNILRLHPCIPKTKTSIN